MRDDIYARRWWLKRKEERLKERENKKNKKPKVWKTDEEYYGSEYEHILFFTEGRKAVDEWKAKKEREATND